MVGFLAVLVMSAVAVLGLAAAINFFGQTGWRPALGWGAFLVGCFLFFWVLGLWEGASLHAWGVLGFAFLLILAGGWVLLRVARRIRQARLERRDHAETR